MNIPRDCYSGCGRLHSIKKMVYTLVLRLLFYRMILRILDFGSMVWGMVQGYHGSMDSFILPDEIWDVPSVKHTKSY